MRYSDSSFATYTKEGQIPKHRKHLDAGSFPLSQGLASFFDSRSDLPVEHRTHRARLQRRTNRTIEVPGHGFRSNPKGGISEEPEGDVHVLATMIVEALFPTSRAAYALLGDAIDR